MRESEFRLALTRLTSSEVERYRHPSLRSSYCHHRQFQVRLHATSCRLHRLWLSLVCSRIRKTAHRNRMRPRRLRKDGSPHSFGSASGAIRALICPRLTGQDIVSMRCPFFRATSCWPPAMHIHLPVIKWHSSGGSISLRSGDFASRRLSDSQANSHSTWRVSQSIACQ